MSRARDRRIIRSAECRGPQFGDLVRRYNRALGREIRRVRNGPQPWLGADPVSSVHWWASVDTHASRILRRAEGKARHRYRGDVSLLWRQDDDIPF